MKLVDISGYFFWVKVFPAHKDFFSSIWKKGLQLCVLM